jgi:SNF2 family DNA or RNA helicase
MGQKKPVFVYRYLLRNTVEQRIFEVLNAKNQLFDSYIDNHSQTPDELEKIIDKALSIDDLLQIVKPSEPV